MTVVEIAPVVKSIVVERSALDAFHLFTEQIGAWWPLATHTLANHAQGQSSVTAVIEAHEHGRVYEVLHDGTELDWGVVVSFEAGVHFAMRWHLQHPVEEATLVSVSFEALTDASCRLVLVHSDWERMGTDAASARANYEQGWAGVFEDRYAAYAAQTKLT